MQKLCCVCTRQQFSASLDYFVTSSPTYLHQFSTISGGNCISIQSGAASRSGQPVWAPRVCDEILAIAKGFTDMGLPDPRLTSAGLMDPRLTRLYSAYSHEDPAPHQVKPLPIQIIHHATGPSSPLPWR